MPLNLCKYHVSYQYNVTQRGNAFENTWNMTSTKEIILVSPKVMNIIPAYHKEGGTPARPSGDLGTDPQRHQHLTGGYRFAPEETPTFMGNTELPWNSLRVPWSVPNTIS